MTQKRLAIQFFGHLRTYKDTYESFFKHIVEPNLKDGWEIDIFIHTWDKMSEPEHGKRYGLYDTRQVTQDDIKDVNKIYKPKCFDIDHFDGGDGLLLTKTRGNISRNHYCKKHKIHYDYILYTRFDLLFKTDLSINKWINLYATSWHLKSVGGIPEKHCFMAINPFSWLKVIDMRVVNEGDLLYFSNCSFDNPKPWKQNDIYPILIDYFLSHDFFIRRGEYVFEDKRNIFYNFKSVIKSQKENIENLNNQLNTLNTEINSYPIKKQSLEISNLEQDLINKKLKAQILEKELGLDNEINLKYNNALQENENLKAQLSKLNQEFETNNPKSKSENQKLQKINTDLYFALNYGTAKSRIKNQLSYKLGEAMIANSKSIWGYIRMPYILSYIKETHQKNQKLYQEKIKANPSLKLPPLETYPDYNEAIKIKEHLSYKLGEALINADKSKLVYLTLWFKCKKITKEHKKAKNENLKFI